MKLLVTTVLVLALACGADAVNEMINVPDAGAQDGEGGGSGGSGGIPPGVQIECDQQWTETQKNFDYLRDSNGSAVYDDDGNPQRGELKYTTTTVRKFAWVQVDDPRAAIVTNCGRIDSSPYSDRCSPDYPGNDWGTEITCNNQPERTNCTTVQAVQYIGNRAYVECLTASTITWNRSWSRYDGEQDIEYQSGWQTTTISGTGVTQ